MSALPKPTNLAVLTAWQLEPVALLAVLLLAAVYAYGIATLRRRGTEWPAWRVALFVLGLVWLGYATSGFPAVYRTSLFWVWTTQILLVWLLVPLLLVAGGAVHLTVALGGPEGRAARVLHSRPIRVMSHPLVGPALVPALSMLLFFGPVAGWSATGPVFAWLLFLALVLVGAVIVLPLVGPEEDITSLAIGMALGLGMLELVLDAFPGLVLRLSAHPVTTFFVVRQQFGWTPAILNDQRVAGTIVWVIGEAIDLPFLVIVYRRWIRADAREAARIDAVLEAERVARLGAAHEDDAGTGVGVADVPWWLTDDDMRRRLDR